VVRAVMPGYCALRLRSLTVGSISSTCNGCNTSESKQGRERERARERTRARADD